MYSRFFRSATLTSASIGSLATLVKLLDPSKSYAEAQYAASWLSVLAACGGSEHHDAEEFAGVLAGVGLHTLFSTLGILKGINPVVVLNLTSLVLAGCLSLGAYLVDNNDENDDRQNLAMR